MSNKLSDIGILLIEYTATSIIVSFAAISVNQNALISQAEANNAILHFKTKMQERPAPAFSQSSLLRAFIVRKHLVDCK